MCSNGEGCKSKTSLSPTNSLIQLCVCRQGQPPREANTQLHPQAHTLQAGSQHRFLQRDKQCHHLPGPTPAAQIQAVEGERYGCTASRADEEQTPGTRCPSSSEPMTSAMSWVIRVVSKPGFSLSTSPEKSR